MRIFPPQAENKQTSSWPLSVVVRVLTAILIIKVTLSILSGYPNYFPPNFNTDFLLGRERYFWGWYSWAF